MVQKKVVDDYYVNISGENKEIDTSLEPKKVKLKAKKKAVVVKKEDLKKEEFKKEKTDEGVVLDKTEKLKKPIQRISVVKKASGVSKTQQKPRVELNNKVARKAPLVVKKQDLDKRNSEKTINPQSSGEKITIRGTNKPQKVFKQNTTNESNKKQDEENNKKSKFSFKDKKTRGRVRFIEEKDQSFIRSNKLAKKRKEEKKVEDIKQNLTDHKGQTIIVGDILSLKELSEKIGVALPNLIAEFMKNGMMVNINSKIDFDSASIIAEIFEIKLEKDVSSGAKIEDIISGDLTTLLAEEDSSKLITRSPIVSIMGHVDHGKTSLLDYIRKTKVTTGEAGGITQSIGAYQVELDSGKITFLDTPGHEAFTIMRARGAKLTDIAILVVAADEGVKPQTIESINHAKEAGISIIVAINKMDKVGANPDHVKGQLSERGLTAEDWGGDIPMIPVSAISGFGVEDLLEMILLVAEMKELKANPNRNAIATVIESHLDQKLGPIATVLINTGTINKNDNIVCNESFGKVKILKDYTAKNILKAGPGEPVLIVGLDKVVEGGNILQILNTPELAKQKSLEYREILLKEKKAGTSSLDRLMSKIKDGSLKQLKIILKADTNGSLEAIKSSLEKLSTKDVSVSIIHDGVGGITEGDILMGQGSDAILIGFNVGVLVTAKQVLESSGVEFISSDIIYNITEKIEKIITGMLDIKEVETILCRAKVAGIFYTSKEFMVVGLKIKDGEKIEKNTKIRVIRNKKIVGTGNLKSLKSGTIEVKELEGPNECGIKYEGKTVLEMGDELEVFKIEKIV